MMRLIQDHSIKWNFSVRLFFNVTFLYVWSMRWACPTGIIYHHQVKLLGSPGHWAAALGRLMPQRNICQSGACGSWAAFPSSINQTKLMNLPLRLVLMPVQAWEHTGDGCMHACILGKQCTLTVSHYCAITSVYLWHSGYPNKDFHSSEPMWENKSPRGAKSVNINSRYRHLCVCVFVYVSWKEWGSLKGKKQTSCVGWSDSSKMAGFLRVVEEQQFILPPFFLSAFQG